MLRPAALRLSFNKVKDIGREIVSVPMLRGPSAGFEADSLFTRFELMDVLEAAHYIGDVEAFLGRAVLELVRVLL